jgi:hypothetical protein
LLPTATTGPPVPLTARFPADADWGSLRQTARLLAKAAVVSGESTLAQVALITRLAALAEAAARNHR